VREDFPDTPLIALDEQIGEARHLFEKSGKDSPMFCHSRGRIDWVNDCDPGRIAAKRVCTNNKLLARKLELISLPTPLCGTRHLQDFGQLKVGGDGGVED
jgi:hypothetical protein